MEKRLRIVILLILLQYCVAAQVLPGNNAILNYRLAGFMIPENTKAVSYLFQVAQGNIAEDAVFIQKIVAKNKSVKNKTVIKLPLFGTTYTWRVICFANDGKECGRSDLYHFSTGYIKAIDTNYNGLAVLSKATHHKDLLILVDGVFVIYDIEGQPVWYMPDIPGKIERGIDLRDFKATANGTFTMMSAKGIFEVDWDGRIVWSGPNDGIISREKTENYHHEFTKLNNGHYMVAAAENIWRQIPADPGVYFADGDTSVRKFEDGRYYKNITCGSLIEYDAGGSVVWYWKSSEHFNDRDYFRPRKALDRPFDSRAYLNAFEFDEDRKVIYLSFKNINRVVKIAYPSGEILNNYGEVVNADLSIDENSPFYGQHTCRVDKGTNNLYLYNNNYNDFKDFSKSNMNPDGNIVSHAVVYKQENDGKLKKLWDYSCRLASEVGKPLVSTRGGSVKLLSDGCMQISMGTLNHVMIIGADQKLIWDAAPYTTDAMKAKKALIPYRMNYMNVNDIQRFVFRDN